MTRTTLAWIIGTIWIVLLAFLLLYPYHRTPSAPPPVGEWDTAASSNAITPSSVLSLVLSHVPSSSAVPLDRLGTTNPAFSSEAGSARKPLQWGAFVGPGVVDGPAFEEKIGKTMTHQAMFVHWGNEREFPLYLKDSLRGKTLVIFWEAMDYNDGSAEQPAFSYKAILRGDWDTYFETFANQAKEYGNPVILIPFEEMNGAWYPWSGFTNGNTPEEHIAAYRYVHGFFRDTPNVLFGWAVNDDSDPDTAENAIEKYYPGNAYVDIVGINGFNFDDPWESFDEIFGPALGTLRAYGKPVFIFSMACADGPQKAAWIRDALTVQIPLHPEIAGWMWFNENKERDWRIWSDEASLQTFREALQ